MICSVTSVTHNEVVFLIKKKRMRRSFNFRDGLCFCSVHQPGTDVTDKFKSSEYFPRVCLNVILILCSSVPRVHPHFVISVFLPCPGGHPVHLRVHYSVLSTHPPHRCPGPALQTPIPTTSFQLLPTDKCRSSSENMNVD